MKAGHPATYTNNLIPIFAELLKPYPTVLDPFAGTGKLALIKDYGYTGKVFCNEMEPEWTKSNQYPVDQWHIGDSANMEWAEDNMFDAICTSPTYGNRMADHFNAKDNSKRITYKHYLGRDLDIENTGRMQWGERYRGKHREVYSECFRVLKDGGIFILNISDHIRSGEIIKVSDWHKQCLLDMGLNLEKELKIKTPRMRFGKNNKVRVNHEDLFVLRK